LPGDQVVALCEGTIRAVMTREYPEAVTTTAGRST
jgi:hypothetical protein